MSVFDVVRAICSRPDEWLLKRWNWKSAIFSPGTRSLVFFFANLNHGLRAALGAMFAELAYRGLTAGLYGAMTQAFRKAEPEWAACLTVMALLPAVQHSIEFAIHYLRGTPSLKASIVSSLCFTAVSTAFNLYAMRRGALVTGEGCGSVWADLKRMPRLIAGFVAAGPVAIFRFVRAYAIPKGRSAGAPMVGGLRRLPPAA